MRRTSSNAALGVMLASGFVGLGYQIVWTQQAALWLGHEAAAVLAVVTAFFGGIALGALALARRIERSPRPERAYAACELGIAAWSVVLALVMAPLADAVLRLTGAQPGALRQWAVAFVASFVVLLPATAAMGATLPAMQGVLERLGPHARGSGVAALYAANTAGAVLGALGVAFWLVPSIGLARSAAVCAVLNLVCAAAALRWGRAPAASTAVAPPVAAPPTEAVGAGDAPGTPAAPRRLLVLLAATGLIGVGYEVLVVRVISQIAENTVYTFAIVLAVYLVGTTLGAAAYTHAARRRPAAGPGPTTDRLLLVLAAACLLGSLSLWSADTARDALRQVLAPGMGAALAAEAGVALLAFLLPTLVMGALFSHLATQARRAGLGLGPSLGVNTLGAAAAPLLFGVLLLPALGAKTALLAVPAGYVLLASRRVWAAPAAWSVAAAGLALVLWAPPLVLVDIPEGGRLVSYREGAVAAVSVVQDAAGVSRLRIDNRQQEGSSATRLADARQAWLPLLLHPAPRRALFLGLGTGVTAGSAADAPGLQVDAAELLPEVIAASALFRDGAAPHPRLHLIAADARRFVRAADAHYDVIVSDNFHPARSGSGSLYTLEHFEAVRARLAADGVFCQWLPLHQLDLATLRSIVRSFLAAFPEATAMLATNSLDTPVFGLVGRAADGRFELRAARARLADALAALPLQELGLADDLSVWGGFVAGPAALAHFAADAALNTDDHPVVAYAAPRITYAPDSSPRERLLALLQQLHTRPDELIDAAADTAWPPRLAAYWAARDRFIAAGRDVRPSADAAQMLAQVREPLLQVLRISPDFRPAYDPLLRLASALGRRDAATARALLAALVQVQPARPEAGEALRGLAATTDLTAVSPQAAGPVATAATGAQARSP